MTYYGMNDPYGKGPLFDVKTNKVTYLRPDPKDYVNSNVATGWRASIPHVNYNGRYVEVLKKVPLDPTNRISAYAIFLFLPNEQTYYKFDQRSKPIYLTNGAHFDSLILEQNESTTSIKTKLKKLSQSNKVIGINPATVCPLIHKLTKPGGDPQGLLPLLDLIVDLSERNLNSPSTGCTIL